MEVAETAIMATYRGLVIFNSIGFMIVDCRRVGAPSII